MVVASIGRESYIGGGGDIEANVVIGNYTSIASHVQMLARPQHACIADPLLVACGPAHALGLPGATRHSAITIGSDVWIGRDAVLLAPIAIGHGAIIGAFSVVAKDIPPYAVVVGNPVQIIRYRYVLRDGTPDWDTINSLLAIRWWDWPEDVIAERAEDLHDVRVLLSKYGNTAPLS